MQECPKCKDSPMRELGYITTVSDTFLVGPEGEKRLIIVGPRDNTIDFRNGETLKLRTPEGHVILSPAYIEMPTPSVADIINISFPWPLNKEDIPVGTKVYKYRISDG